MKLLALDPGNTETAYCLYDTEEQEIINSEKLANEEVLEIVYESNADWMVCEMIACYGMAVGKSVFDTCVWIGRFQEAWLSHQHVHDPAFAFLFRREVKMHLCNSTRAKDKNVNRVLLDRFGDWTHGKTGKGTKEHPGALYGFNGDMFAALGVAVTYTETKT